MVVAMSRVINVCVPRTSLRGIQLFKDPHFLQDKHCKSFVTARKRFFLVFRMFFVLYL